ncbi:Na+/H+ antiporter NhaA [uncultured Nocardioides sp.]|uniref:Na+/H+ antiporter NhaA n=1 Tax=uncultured Nocardioides sp. TaxID=198441 RepID=UPI002621AED6|nr:Na+/H+ antiporter NhaA [uncultured Nocardioides sp.]
MTADIHARSTPERQSPRHRHDSRPGRSSRRASLLAALSRETTGGLLLIGAAVAALVWANSPWGEAYVALAGTVVGPAALNLDLSLSTWAADGALAIFFFVVGLELKHELRVGSLRDPRAAAVPVIAAIGGMALPALAYVAVVLAVGERDLLSGWAIPTATDIAFALAVLAVFGRGLPGALRLFLLTLAVVDDLLAVTIIAVFYTEDLAFGWLALSLATVGLFAWAARARVARTALLLPLSVVAWVLMHESGVHATIAGVLLGLAVPATPRAGEATSRVHRLEGLNRPLSGALALPVFAFFSAGVVVSDVRSAVTDPLTLAIAAGLLGGKLLGILGGAAVAVRLPGLRLDDGLSVRDLLPVALLAAIGFTVSLLITDLSFADPAVTDAAKLAVLAASLVAATLAALVLRLDARRHARL